MAGNRYLADTHSFLWALQDSKQLGATARKAIADPEAVVFVSIASLWEISIKCSIGKLGVPDDFFSLVADSAYNVLPISLRHLERYRSLPLLHRDPFDRILVSQAQEDQLTMVTHDEEIKAYGGFRVLEVG